jgi:hypothetical protein
VRVHQIGLQRGHRTPRRAHAPQPVAGCASPAPAPLLTPSMGCRPRRDHRHPPAARQHGRAPSAAHARCWRRPAGRIWPPRSPALRGALPPGWGRAPSLTGAWVPAALGLPGGVRFMATTPRASASVIGRGSSGCSASQRASPSRVSPTTTRRAAGQHREVGHTCRAPGCARPPARHCPGCNRPRSVLCGPMKQRWPMTMGARFTAACQRQAAPDSPAATRTARCVLWLTMLTKLVTCVPSPDAHAGAGLDELKWPMNTSSASCSAPRARCTGGAKCACRAASAPRCARQTACEKTPTATHAAPGG